jgi:thiamine biosynthesis lipoprotein
MDCADADGYATAFMAMGLKDTQAFLKSNPGIKGFLIYSDGEGQIKTFKTENLKLVKD